MNRNEILNMQAGLEMDALVAERVMKIDLTQKCDGEMYDEDGQNWSCTACGKTGNWGDDFGHMIKPRRYSESILWAWEVVNELIKRGYGFDLDWVGTHYLVGFTFYTSPSNLYFPAMDELAPLAICRAALLAVMEE